MALKIETLGPESCCFFFFPAKRIWGKNRYLTKKWHEFNYSLFWGYNIVCSPINQERKLSRKLRIPCREHRMQLKNLNNSNRDGQPPAQRGIWSSLVMTPHIHTLHHKYYFSWTKDTSSRSSISKVKTALPNGWSWVYSGAESNGEERGRMGAQGTGVPP